MIYQVMLIASISVFTLTLFITIIIHYYYLKLIKKIQDNDSDLFGSLAEMETQLQDIQNKVKKYHQEKT